MEICLNVNGNKHHLMIEADEMLLDVLRRIGYLSVKRGCDTGSCGICSVLVDKKLMSSCSLYAYRVQEMEIVTVEGIEERAREIGEFIANEGADQCGYCSPSLVMAIYAMTQELENPSEEDIKHYLAGNLCRCSGYEGQHRAIRKYLGVKSWS